MTDGGKYKQTETNKQTNTKTVTMTKIELNKDEIESAELTLQNLRLKPSCDMPHAFSAVCCVFKVFSLVSVGFRNQCK